MLLLTDRISRGHHLCGVLSAVEPCSLLGPGSPELPRLDHSVVLCDVALDHASSLEAVQALLARYRAPDRPLLCLSRQGGDLALTQAQAIGASAALPADVSDEQILFTVRQLVKAPRAAAGPRAGAGRSDADVAGRAETAHMAFHALFTAVGRGQPIGVEHLVAGGDAVLAAVGGGRIGAWLDAVRCFDDMTYQHCLIVAGLAAAFSIRLGMSLAGQRLVAQAALVHDIGKARIPLDILNKPERLTPDETAVMRDHPAIGHRMLALQGGFSPQLLDVVLHHHEMLDGSGYPDRLKADAIAPLVRLTTICDIYAALVERRPYKAPKSQRDAFAVLAGMGAKLDAALLRSFGGLVGAI